MELLGLTVKYWPACRFNESPLIGVITEVSGDLVAKLAIYPDYDGPMKVVQTAYKRGDKRLSLPNGAASEAALKWGCWDFTESASQCVKCGTVCCKNE